MAKKNVTAKTGTELVITTELADELSVKVQALELEIERLKLIDKSDYIGNKTSVFNNSNIYIDTEQSIMKLTSFLSEIARKNDDYMLTSREIQKAVGLNDIPLFKYDLNTYTQWKHNIILRITIISQHEQLKLRTSQLGSLQEHISKDMKLRKKLNNIDI